MEVAQQLQAARQVVRQHWDGRPRCGVILGTGAADVANRIEGAVRIPYSRIPGFPQSTAPGHEGRFVCGQLADHAVIAMQGRFHVYEGYRDLQIALPLQLMRSLGVQLLLISNAAGGLNPAFESGQLMVLESHLDLMFRSWRVAQPKTLAGRPTARADVYDRRLIQRSLKHARREDFVLHRGVYAGMPGPNYETRAEYRFLRRVGADVVGMSTIPEVVFAAQLGMRVLAFSIVANVARPDALEPTSGQQVIDAAAVAAPRLCSLLVNAIGEEADGRSGVDSRNR
jgi:purine-nucleoside phosphorylase